MVDKQSPPKPEPGDRSAWAALSALLSGIVVWGGIGALLDHWLHIPNGLGLLVGMMIGLATGVYVVVKRFG